MPQRAPRVCTRPGCAGLVRGSVCSVCGPRRQADDNRPNATERGYGARRWKRYRKAFLAENPLCAECLRHGETIPADTVDHIVPVTGPDDPTFWDRSNHQALCRSCHSRKTRREANARC